MAQSPYQQLEQEFRRLDALRSAANLLRWDAAVMMPGGSAKRRGEQLAALESECHSILTAPKVSRLLERADANLAGLNEWQQVNLRLMRRARDRAIATPNLLVSKLAHATALAEVRWLEAKRQSDFALFAPQLEEVLRLVRDRAHLLGQALSMAPYDALLDEFSPGVTTAEINKMFTAVGHRLPGLISEAIELQARQPIQETTGRYAAGKQRQLAMEVMRVLGFPFDQGRLDESEHPFTGGVPGDIRITSRFVPQDPLSGLLGVLHETGHAMYFQGLPQQWRGQPVGNDAGMAVQESQSLLLEMFIGRSRPMLSFLKPLLEKYLNALGAEWEIDNLYRHFMRVRRSLIRMDADELTYPVHVMLRYDLEQDLLNNELKIAELPEVWADGMESRLGVRPANAAEGCLQDIHWAQGSFGYFPSYAIGAFIAGQLYEKLRSDCPGLDEEVAAGQFANLFAWLKENIYSAGGRFTAAELTQAVTERPLSASAWLRYAENKYLQA
jgi:carboxypeptidase Taq